MQSLEQSFEQFFAKVISSTPLIVTGILMIVLFVAIGGITAKGIKKIIGKRATSVKKINLITRLIRWTFNLIGLTIALHIMGLTEAASGVIAAGGVLTVVLGFAFREIGENLLAGLFMSFSRSFDVGDLIESNNIRGVVQRIEIRDVHVRTAEGADVFIPSNMIYKNPLNNFTRDKLRRYNFAIGIDYRNDLKEAQKLLLIATNEVEGVLREPESVITIGEFSDNYVKLEVFYWINTLAKSTNGTSIKNEVMSNCHKVLAENGFTFSSEVSTSVELLGKEP